MELYKGDCLEIMKDFPDKSIDMILCDLPYGVTQNKKDITIDDVVGYETIPTKILNPLRDFINLNYDVLIQYWNDEISTKQMILSIKGIK
jgi:DNA modification methylase